MLQGPLKKKGNLTAKCYQKRHAGFAESEDMCLANAEINTTNY